MKFLDSKSLSCFKAYDVRGRVPDELNYEVARRIGRAYASVVKPNQVVVGNDIRISSEEIKKGLIYGLCDQGVSVLDIGLCGTEEIYFATHHTRVGGGIMVTASHNPIDYNGMKFVREDAMPISGDSGLNEIRSLAEINDFKPCKIKGRTSNLDTTSAYIDHLLSYVDVSALPKYRIVSNPGNGGAGRIIDLLESRLPVEFSRVHHEPNGSFPNGVPNPLISENRISTSQAVIENNADLGLAWDGDFDRCFFFDSNGKFIEGYYIVGLLAEAFLEKAANSTVVHDPRLIWNTMDIVETYSGRAIQSKTGHAYIKETMRKEDGVYGGEMSAHHYFRDFFYCDSGMIPWLLVCGLMASKKKSLNELVEARQLKFPCSGEINLQVSTPDKMLEEVEKYFSPEIKKINRMDGISVDCGTWRFSLRASNTEPLVRLNVESRGNLELMNNKTKELLKVIDSN